MLPQMTLVWVRKIQCIITLALKWPLIINLVADILSLLQMQLKHYFKEAIVHFLQFTDHSVNGNKLDKDV